MPAPGEAARREAVREVVEIYRDLEARPAERSCIGRAECCQFRLTGKTPYLTRGEALVVAAAWKASGRRSLPEIMNGACPLLSEAGRCQVYEARPMGCRTHFCQAAGGPRARREVADLIHRLEVVDSKLGGRGARPIAAAVSEALTGKRRG